MESNIVKSYVFLGDHPGKHLLVLGAIHGNEICGTRAMERLIKEIEGGKIALRTGKVTFVPLCNPKAYENKTRYFEENLNRVFKDHPLPLTYEQRLANEITPFFESADYLLDIHSQHVDGEPFCLIDDDSKAFVDFVSALCPKHVFFDWNTLYPDGDYTTESFARSLNMVATTIECGKHNNPKSIEVAYQAILRAMRFLGLIDPVETSDFTPFEPIYMTQVHRYQEAAEIAKPWQHLDPVTKGDLLARYKGGQEVRAAHDGFVVFPMQEAPSVGDEWFYLAANKRL